MAVAVAVAVGLAGGSVAVAVAVVTVVPAVAVGNAGGGSVRTVARMPSGAETSAEPPQAASSRVRARIDATERAFHDR